ncbi:MAG: SAM-dependent DNA methyltransferase, partial [Spirochaetia bacterium]|nr:SAM-dependent DNA methyltransferase [Spirochaetia bacterium]
MNERIVEDFVCEELKNLGYINIEKQSSKNSLIQQALNKASKSGKGNSGRPEFIVQFSNAPDVVMIVECKADSKKHQSANLSDPVNYAVDGVLHYASFLTKNFKVIALAVSGENEKKLSSFVVTEKARKELNLTKIMDEVYYTNSVAQELRGEMLQEANLLNYAKIIHNYLRDFAKLSETEKPLIVGGALIALYDRTFRESYNTIPTAQRLASETVRAIQQVLEDSNIDGDKINSIIQPYSFIAVHPELTKGDTLVTFLKMLENNVYHSTYSSIDMVGEFYKEFLRYTGGDKKGLGIVLTPTHVTELFCKLANLTVNSVVVDPCCGTGGFLISAMHDMLTQAGDDTDLQKKIKQNNLVGIEQSPNMFALACSNMILRGDGKANLKMGSCFGFRDSIKAHRPTVGMINPPYSQKWSSDDK